MTVLFDEQGEIIRELGVAADIDPEREIERRTAFLKDYLVASGMVTKRSLLADQNPGGLYLIGGYAEPGESDGPVDIFNEIAREVEEEIAVGDVSRSEAVAIGLAYDPVFCHPELFLLMPSKSTAADILSGADAAPDRNEASELLVYSVDDVLDDIGPHKYAALTWSFIKARKFLQLHLR